MFNIDEQPELENGNRVLPVGGYRVIIGEAKFRYKNGNVNHNWINVKFEVLPYDGVSQYELQGRVIYNSFTWESDNEKAVSIGRSTLADLIFATRPTVRTFDYPEEICSLLLNKEVYIRVYHSKHRETGEIQAKIGGFWTLDGKQRSRSPQPLPPPPTARDVASAPVAASRTLPMPSSSFSDDVPF